MDASAEEGGCLFLRGGGVLVLMSVISFNF